MKIYTVHERGVPEGTDPDAVFVKEGFSWFAFVFGIFWLTYKRLWWELLGFVVAFIVLFSIAGAAGLSDDTVSNLMLVAMMWFGAEANNFYRRGLRRKGYDMTGTIAGGTLGEAEYRYFKHHDMFAAAHP